MGAEIVDLAGFGYEKGMSQTRGTDGHSEKPGSRLVLEVRHLKLIQAIAREGSVTRAAPSLNLSQSALSHQLLNLERDLGAKLFDRVGKRMVPTAAGAVLLETAADVLGRLAETERAVKQPSEERSPLRVAAGCFTYYQWLSGALARFGADHPDIDVQIALGSTQRELQAVLDDEVDLAVTSRVLLSLSWSYARVLIRPLRLCTSRAGNSSRSTGRVMSRSHFTSARQPCHGLCPMGQRLSLSPAGPLSRARRSRAGMPDPNARSSSSQITVRKNRIVLDADCDFLQSRHAS